MPKRQAIYTYKSDEVQGEGSFVKIRAVTYGEAKKLRGAVQGMTDDEKVVQNEQLIIDKIVEWNWVDDDGNPLPRPKDDPTVLESLTAQEMAFLGECFAGGAGDRKNESSG
ncbi:MAG TPA: hypothetical protein PKD09_17825 [Aggregatilinea sp.]|uniref:hypothetical protein n=1 Tax=Aggregatilinea sp. TaxID=2806333 RepID=UPI002B7E42D0|nr:hypothetical protein [Aggregatilinea sp.]HML23520.1 hypothetical protein [Aggregatilinea sp.]